MTYFIDIQHAHATEIPISDDLLTKWATLTLTEHHATAEITLRLVSLEEMTHLNQRYRNKEGPTNVLAFPATHSSMLELEQPFLGDVIISPDVLKQESEAQQTPLSDHWAHIVIHGILHLLGYDHIKEDDAIIMQSLEIELLAKLNVNNPYSEATKIEQRR